MTFNGQLASGSEWVKRLKGGVNLNQNVDLSCIIVIFGGTGDLTHRKLMPALYNLAYQQMLPEDFAVVSIGRRILTDEEYRNQVKQSVEKYSRFPMEEEIWKGIESRIYYLEFDFQDNHGYIRLNNVLKNLDEKYKTNGNRIYYLAVSPEHFEPIVDKLKLYGMNAKENSHRRIVIEKPFGRDLQSAAYLNEKITLAFSEENIYRIDHYLGKEMIQNIMVIRFANVVYESLWNSKYIDNIQISSSEIVGVENRGGYYESSGALKDMVQNHMFQLLSLIAMEPPASLNTENIRDEKVKVLQSIESVTPEYIKENMVRGQYGKGIIGNNEVLAYREEEKVAIDSDVETFAAMKLHIQNYRWAGVPFYIRTGKRLANKSTEIVVQFKSLDKVLYFKEFDYLEPNLLGIKIQPCEGVYFQMNGKKPGVENEIIPIQMDFCQNCNLENNSPEAYERLIFDVMKGDSTLFTRWDEVEYSWRFVDAISKVWKNIQSDLPIYNSGTWGPDEADDLLKKDGRNWWNI
ncbi:glucose-6-phosphate dehydrogenase [Clostridium aciditolerans]|uniref:Glucose-6-phosphate 1-dehydrogenase n=1 Tax=Clostridium aciditolerans TaxID=339861 RepID=A0A934I5E1_9CLOT|nr:glucose-6-phosphate dehydrogenase [Clostridium aciditolerans]